MRSICMRHQVTWPYRLAIGLTRGPLDDAVEGGVHVGPARRQKRGDGVGLALPHRVKLLDRQREGRPAIATQTARQH
jgi:hypothetical protein